MGLDNIPHVYPCTKAGSAIMTDDGKIDCDATIAADQCPWKAEMAARGTPHYGMFGTPCWYRGKSGNYMVDAVQEAGHPLPPEISGGFYGVKGNSPELSPEYCTTLGDWMAERIEAFAATVTDPEERKSALDAYRYAAWWLRWIATAGDGSNTWW